MAASLIDWRKAHSNVSDHSVHEVDWLLPGEAAARARAANFIKKGLHAYDKERNDPNRDGQSGMSPYLHFGHIAPQRMALLVNESREDAEAQKAFLEELQLRKTDSRRHTRRQACS